jgi:hypothetical protein
MAVSAIKYRDNRISTEPEVPADTANPDAMALAAPKNKSNALITPIRKPASVGEDVRDRLL